MSTPNQCQFWDCDETIRRDHFLCFDHYTKYEIGVVDCCPSCGRYKYTPYAVCLTCRQQGQTAEARSPSRSAPAPPGGQPDEALFEELRALRRNLARAYSLQDYMVFSNETLAEMAAVRPMSPEAMLAINGVGPTKLERYGPDFLYVIRESVPEPPVKEHRQPPPRPNTVQRDNREFPADKEADRFFVYILLLTGGEYYIGQTREIDERMHEHRNNMSQSTKGREPKLQWFTTVDTRSQAADLESELQELNSNPTDRRKITRLVADFKRLAVQLDYTPHRPAAENTVQERPLPYGGMTPPSTRRR